MTKHTPGPWFIRTDGTNATIEYETSDLRSVICGLADVALCKEHGAIMPNARLIAAAPDLLAALAGCHDALVESAKQHRQQGDGPGHGQLCERHAEIARAAIDKATTT